MNEMFSRVRYASPSLRIREENNNEYMIYCPETDEMHIVGEIEKKIFDLCQDNELDTIMEKACPLLAKKGITDELIAKKEIFYFLHMLHERKIISYE